MVGLSPLAAWAEGSPYASRFLHAYGNFLAPPDKEARDAVDLALRYLERAPTALGVAGSDVAELELFRLSTSEHNGLTHLSFRQRHQGIEVDLGKVYVHVHPSGHILAVGSHLASDIEARLASAIPRIDFTEALERAAERAGLLPGSPSTAVVLEDEGGPSMRRMVELPELSRAPIPVELKIVPSASQVRLAWSLQVEPPGGSDAYVDFVDALDGEGLGRRNLTAHAGPQYTVFPLPVESPAHGDPVTVAESADPVASPVGWADQYSFGCFTVGNNVMAFEVVNGQNHLAFGQYCHFTFTPGGSPVTLERLEDPGDLGMDLSTYRDAALANLFHTANLLHDIFYRYGFNEVAGNFQEDNFGRGGVEGDRLPARRDPGFLNNSGMFPGTPAPTLRMGYTPVQRADEIPLTAPAGAVNPVSIAAGALNGDPYADLVTANQDTDNITVFLNNTPQPGSFSAQNHPLPGSTAPAWITLGYMNCDASLDIVVACPGSGDVHVLLNSGSGASFASTRVTAGLSAPNRVEAADLDGDGLSDLAAADQGTQGIALFQGLCGFFIAAGSLALPGTPTALLAADLDGNGDPDLACATGGADGVSLFQGQAGLSFSGPVTLSPAPSDPSSLTAADLDSDGDLDLAVAEKGSARVSLWRNDGGLSFSEARRGRANSDPVAVAAAETRPDGSRVALELNRGEAAEGQPFGADLAVANAGPSTLSVRLNRPVDPWLFTRPKRLPNDPRGRTPRADLALDHAWVSSLVAAELTGDLEVDLAVAFSDPASAARASVLRNDSQGYGNFLDATGGAWDFLRDHSLDNGMVSHELSHGVVDERLTDLRNGNKAQSSGMSEGVADFFALAMTQGAGPEVPRTLFAFANGEGPEGHGWRTVPFSRDQLLDPLTYADYNYRRCSNCSLCTVPGACSASTRLYGLELLSEHAIGEIWASTLWDIYWALADAFGRSNDLLLGGFDPASGGDNIALQLVIDGLRLQPRTPGRSSRTSPIRRKGASAATCTTT